MLYVRMDLDFFQRRDDLSLQLDRQSRWMNQLNK